MSILTFALAACTPEEPAKDSGAHTTCEASEPACIDEIILDLSLHDNKVSDGAVTTEADGAGFRSSIDASAGGYNNASRNPWVYVRFTETGLERVDIDDETALEDTSWHLALRRFIVRVNSGDSGPGCVGAAPLFGTAYDDVSAAPDGLTFREDDFYTEDCTIVNDSSGLPGSPQVAMGSWWSYPSSCVATTGTPFVLDLGPDGAVKLVIDEYYADGGQAECNETGATTADSGYYTMRWAAL